MIKRMKEVNAIARAAMLPLDPSHAELPITERPNRTMKVTAWIWKPGVNGMRKNTLLLRGHSPMIVDAWEGKLGDKIFMTIAYVRIGAMEESRWQAEITNTDWWLRRWLRKVWKPKTAYPKMLLSPWQIDLEHIGNPEQFHEFRVSTDPNNTRPL